MSVSIIQVAEAADVSRMTVTRVMRGDSVKESTRKRVLAAMSQLGYVPSSAARAMRSKDALKASEASCFALVFSPDTQKADEFFCEVARGVEKQAAEFELCALQVHWLDGLANSWPRMQSVLAVRGLCGAILVGQFSGREVQAVEKAAGHVVVVDGPVPVGVSARGVVSDNISGSKFALEHLLASGCKNVVVIAGPKRHYFTKAMQQAAMQYCRQFKTCKIIHSDYSSQNTYSIVNALIDEGYEFDSIFANDTTCLGAIRALKEREIKIPEQVKVIGFDNIPACEFLMPSLTSIDIDKQKLGSEAVRTLVELVRGNKDSLPPQIVIKAELIKREST